jgi:hypothetical protein
MMLYRVPLWRDLDADDGASGGAGGVVAAAAAPPQPVADTPTTPPTPQLDPQAYQALLVQNARLQARVEFPQADVALIDTLTDPAAISAVAKRTHELALAAQPPPGQQQGAGVPVPSANAASAAESEDARRLREMQYKVRQRVRPGARGGRTVIEPWEAEEFRDLAFKITWNNHMLGRRTGRSNVSAPPTGAPAAAAQAPQIPAIGRAF